MLVPIITLSRKMKDTRGILVHQSYNLLVNLSF